MSTTTTAAAPQDPTLITNPFAKFMAQTTGFVSDEMQSVIASRKELDTLKRMLEGQPPFLCEKCGRPKRVTRQTKMWAEKENPEWKDTVPIGARRPEKFLRVPRPTYGVYSFSCPGKDADDTSKREPDHRFVYASFSDTFKFNREQLHPLFQRLLHNQEQNAKDPWLTFSDEELDAANRGEWSYLSRETIDAINARPPVA